jgi:hypothetical protein
MIHFTVLIRSSYNITVSQYVEPWLVFVYGCCDIIVVLACGFIIYVTVECPFASLLDRIFGKSRVSVKPKLI